MRKSIGSNSFVRKLPSLASAALVLGGVSGQLLAADRYVRSGAVGSGTGTDWANAYSSLPGNLTRGDTYYIAEGTYVGYTFDDATSGSTPITVRKATASDHGTGTGWSDAYGDGQVVFSGGLVFTSSYYVVDGQTGGGAANNWGDNFGITINESRDGNAVISLGRPDKTGSANNVEIRHVDLRGKGRVSTQGGSYSNDGLAIYGSSNVTLSHFKMSGIGRCPFYISPRNLVVEHGWVESYYGSSDVHSEVASIWAFAGSVGDVTFRYNLFTDIQSTGGLMWDSSSNSAAKLSVYGNVFYKPAGKSWQRANGIVGGWTGGNGEQFRNALVYNNSFINVDQESLSTLPQTFSGNSAYNNIFYNSSSPSFKTFGAHDSNHFINSGGTHSEVNGTTGTGDPFMNMAALDFRLKAGTPQGRSIQAPLNEDPLALVRGSDGVVDRGAFEFDNRSSAPGAPSSFAVR